MFQVSGDESQMGKSWIVLVNRSPRGPLTFDEVSSLLADNTLKRTDLALQVSKDSQEKSEWKFLWQYPEFDARAAQTPPELPNQKERRATVPNANVQKKVAELLPDEIAMINPEDLIVSGKKGKGKSIQSFLSPDTGDGVDELPYSSNGSQNQRSRLGYVAALVVFLLGGYFIKGMVSKFNEVTSPIQVEPSQRAIAKVDSPKVPLKNRPKPVVSVTSPPPSAPKVNPPAMEAVPSKARNEITLEEYEKMKADRADRERAEEEDKRREEEAAEQLAERNSYEQNREGEDVEPSDEEMDQPLNKKSRTKKSSKKARSRQIADDGDVRDQADDRDKTDDREENTDEDYRDRD